MLVDHFAILELPPSATLSEIKSAYRKLVRTCHPDLHPTDLQAAERFRAIQLAYETLSQPDLRTPYMEKRWYARYRNQPLETKPLDLSQVLQKCIELERFVSRLDADRMDRNGLHLHLLQELDDWSMIKWDIEADHQTIEAIQRLLIRSCMPLSHAACHSIHRKMLTWFEQNRSDHLLSEKWLSHKRRIEYFQRTWPVWMGLITILLAILIWLAAR